jgi:hypothetical protein
MTSKFMGMSFREMLDAIGLPGVIALIDEAKEIRRKKKRRSDKDGT